MKKKFLVKIIFNDTKPGMASYMYTLITGSDYEEEKARYLRHVRREVKEVKLLDTENI